MTTYSVEDGCKYKTLLITEKEGKEYDDIILPAFKGWKNVTRINLSRIVGVEIENEKVKKLINDKKIIFDLVVVLSEKNLENENKVVDIIPNNFCFRNELADFIKNKGEEAENKNINNNSKNGFIVTSVESLNKPNRDDNEIANKAMIVDETTSTVKTSDPRKEYRCSCCGELSWKGRVLRRKLYGG